MYKQKIAIKIALSSCPGYGPTDLKEHLLHYQNSPIIEVNMSTIVHYNI